MLACIPVAHPCFWVIFSPALGFSSSRTEGREENDLGRWLFLKGLRVRSDLETYIHSPARFAAGRVPWASRGMRGQGTGRKSSYKGQDEGLARVAHSPMTQEPDSKDQHGRELGYKPGCLVGTGLGRMALKQ